MNDYFSYGKNLVQNTYSLTKKVAVVLVITTIVISGVLFYYYTTTGDRDLLLAGIVILSMLPVDAGILYSLYSSSKRKLPEMIQSLINMLEPSSVGAVKLFGNPVLSMKLRDGSLLYVAVSTKNVNGIYIANPSVTSVEPGLGKIRPPWRLAGLWTTLLSDLRTGFSLQCKSRIVELGEGKAYIIPDPEHPRAISVVGKAWYIAASCPTHLTPERLVYLLEEGLNTINRGGT